MDSKIRFVTTALFIIALTIALLVWYNIKNNSRTISPDKSDISSITSTLSNRIFQQNGLYGVKNSEEEIIIEPVWDYIYSPRINRYIVGETRHGIMYYGALDENGKVAIPVLYESIDVKNSELLCAETFDGKFAVYNMELEIFSDEEFFEITENSNGSYGLVAKNIIYTASVSNRRINIEKLSVNCTIDITSKFVDIIPENSISREIADDYIEMSFESANFVEALFYGNSDGKYSAALLDDSVLLGENQNAQKNFHSLESISPKISNGDEGTKYECDVRFSYGVPIDDSYVTDEFIDNRYDVTAHLTFTRDFEGNFNITSCVFSNS